MKAKSVVAVTATFFSFFLLASPAAAIDPEKQPIYTNTAGGLLCGTHSPPFSPNPCTVPAGQRLIIEHVSGYTFQPTSTDTTASIVMIVNDPALGLNDSGFHTFVANRTDEGPISDTLVFATPFQIMLNPGATYYFSPAAAVSVSGYLVK